MNLFQNVWLRNDKEFIGETYFVFNVPADKKVPKTKSSRILLSGIQFKESKLHTVKETQSIYSVHVT